MEAVAEQYVHDALRDAFGGLNRTYGSRRSGVQIKVSGYSGHAPMVRQLPPLLEEKVRRTIACEACRRTYAVYGAAAFCPFCGPRGDALFVLEQIETARKTLAIEDALDDEQRADLRAHGAFDSLASNALEDVISLIETDLRAEFSRRVPHSEQILKGNGNVFQRLDDADALFLEHAGEAPSALVSDATWKRLNVAVAKRHVIGHRAGEVDERYLEKVPEATHKPGQRLIVSRREAEQLLSDVEALVTALAGRESTATS
jgi:hypothetical protein